MKWTKTKPTKPGWYWQREATGWGLQRMLCVIKLARKLFVVDGSEVTEVSQTSWNWEWAGPIPEPEGTEGGGK